MPLSFSGVWMRPFIAPATGDCELETAGFSVVLRAEGCERRTVPVQSDGPPIGWGAQLELFRRLTCPDVCVQFQLPGLPRADWIGPAIGDRHGRWTGCFGEQAGAPGGLRRPRAGSAGGGGPQDHSSEFRPALAAYEYPLIVWESANTSIVLANKRAADLVGLPLEELVGRQIYDFFLPRDAVERAVLGIQSGTLLRLQARRVVVRQGQEQVPVWVWVRALEIDDRRGGVALVVPSTEVGSSSRDPDVPWRDLCPIVVGMAAADWRIVGISADVSAVLGLAADAYIGLSLLDLIHPDDVALVAEPGGAPEQAAMSLRQPAFPVRR